MFELIEPVEGDAPHKWFLEKNGEGLQHLGFMVEDYDEWKDYLKDQGINVLMEAETDVEGLGHVRGAYKESDKTGGVLFELLDIKPLKYDPGSWTPFFRTPSGTRATMRGGNSQCSTIRESILRPYFTLRL